MKQGEAGFILIMLALAAAAGLLVAASMEMIQEAARAEEAATLTQAAAWQVSQVLEEARNIARQAAADRAPRGQLDAG